MGLNGGRGGEECAKTGETPIFNQITHNLIPLERKSGHKKCKPLKKGLQIFLHVFGPFWAVRQTALPPGQFLLESCSNGVQIERQEHKNHTLQRIKTAR